MIFSTLKREQQNRYAEIDMSGIQWQDNPVYTRMIEMRPALSGFHP
jgi:hypothetical protein